MIGCVGLVEGCPQCQLEQEYLDSKGHTCGQSGEYFSALCEITGEARRNDLEFHRLSHEPERCERCQEPIWDKVGLNGLGLRPCPSRLCWENYCVVCGFVNSSFGPLDCPTCGSLGRRPGVSRLRSLYRMKRKRW